MNIDLIVNGSRYAIEAPPLRRLLDILREDLDLIGTKEGCGEGECGSCTVIMGGKTVNSCLVPAAEADNQNIITIEGLADGENLDPIQEAFVNHSGMQCGFCTPGMIMSARALLDENPDPSEADVHRSISGNLCRCTGYSKIVEAIMNAPKGENGSDSAPKSTEPSGPIL